VGWWGVFVGVCWGVGFLGGGGGGVCFFGVGFFFCGGFWLGGCVKGCFLGGCGVFVVLFLCGVCCGSDPLLRSNL